MLSSVDRLRYREVRVALGEQGVVSVAARVVDAIPLDRESPDSPARVFAHQRQSVVTVPEFLFVVESDDVDEVMQTELPSSQWRRASR